MLSKRCLALAIACVWPLECTPNPMGVVKLMQEVMEEQARDLRASQAKTKDREESDTLHHGPSHDLFFFP